jgi:hypothetical protein
MDQRFEAFIEAAILQAKAAQSLLWADEIAERIASSTPLSVHARDISEQIAREAARLGVAVTVAQSRKVAKRGRSGQIAA